MLEPLDEIFGSAEFEDDGWIAIDVARWQGDDLAVGLEVRPGGSAPHQHWEIACRGVRRSRLERQIEDRIELLDEHVLLLPHQQVHEQLFISSAPSNATAVVGDLWMAHRKVTADWLAAESLFNPHVSLVRLLEAGSGLLASGPRVILEAYEEVLNSHDIRFNRIGTRDPVWWKDGRWVPESEVLRVLVMGDSFVVAESFALSPGHGGQNAGLVV